MFVWIIALLLLAALGIVGYYQGAVRAAFSLIGLLVAALLALPLSGVVKGLLKVFGLEHPVLLGFLGPFIAYLVILIAFKCAALAVHRKVDTYYKYKASDTVRMLFERLNARLGICVGLCNGFIYTILICIVVYVVGYFTLQAATSDKDNIVFRITTRLAEDLRSTRMDKAVAKFIPPLEQYYDGCDVLALIFRNPLLQNRLSTYPVFLLYPDKPEFKGIAGDAKFQEEWAKGASLAEFMAHEKIKGLVENREMFTNTVAALGGDFKDLKTYLETGKSPKYDDEKILGRWEFKENQSFLLSRKKKLLLTQRPVMPRAEQNQLRAAVAIFRNSILIATVNDRIVLKLAKGATQGSWKSGSTGNYILTIALGGTSKDVEATVDGNKLTVTAGEFSLVFEK